MTSLEITTAGNKLMRPNITAGVPTRDYSSEWIWCYHVGLIIFIAVPSGCSVARVERERDREIRG